MEKVNKINSRILVVSSAFSNNDEIRRDLMASTETYDGWNINFFGLGEKFISYVDAKIIRMKEFILHYDNNFDWVIMIDSNDTLFIRQFNEDKIINIFESFNKPVIFTGEFYCYPLHDFEGLYTLSESPIKYLNSGCIIVRKDYIIKLLDYVLFLYNQYPTYKKSGWNPPGDQTYFQLCLFSKEFGNDVIVDNKGIFSVCTNGVKDSYFKIDENGLLFNNFSRPFLLHCQGDNKHARKRDFMKKLNIPVRG